MARAECDDCGNEIPAARREAVPWATTCIGCQSLRERRGEHVAVKGSRLARTAAMLCQDPVFRLYLDRRRRHKHGLSESQLPDGTHSEQDSRDWLCQACGITSRAELDHNDYAAATFKGIRARFGRWRATQKRESDEN